FDARRNQLLALGVVAIEALRPAPGAPFGAVFGRDVTVKRDQVLIRRVMPTQAADENPEEILSDLIAFVGKAQCLAFHAPFVQTVLARTLRAELGVQLPNPWIDLAQLARKL